MINSINLEESVKHICDGDTEDPTIWNFRALSYKQEKFVQKIKFQSSENDNMSFDFIERAENYLHVCLLEPDNFNGTFERDEKAKCIIDDIKPWSDKTLAQIPFQTRDELVTFCIRGYSDLNKEELKN